MQAPSELSAKKISFPTLAPHELQYLWSLSDRDPERKYFSPAGLLTQTVIKFDQNLYAVLGNELGHGFFGKVYISTLYDRKDPNPAETTRNCVVKIADTTTEIKKSLHSILDSLTKMKDEGNLARTLHGLGDCVGVLDRNGTQQIFILLPYLADLTLDKLIKDPAMRKKITCQEWLRFFIVLLDNLDKFHRKTKRLHNDLKPENIGIMLLDIGTELVFSAINILDLGNTLLLNSRGSIGDPRYINYDSYVGTLWGSFKNEKTDIYAIGKTLYQVTDTLVKESKTETDKKSYQKCSALFYSMMCYLQCNRPTLDKSINELLTIFSNQKNGVLPAQNQLIQACQI